PEHQGKVDDKARNPDGNDARDGPEGWNAGHCPRGNNRQGGQGGAPVLIGGINAEKDEAVSGLDDRPTCAGARLPAKLGILLRPYGVDEGPLYQRWDRPDEKGQHEYADRGIERGIE